MSLKRAQNIITSSDCSSEVRVDATSMSCVYNSQLFCDCFPALSPLPAWTAMASRVTFPFRAVADIFVYAGWDRVTKCDWERTDFDSVVLPSLDLADYLRRFLREDLCSGEVLVLASVYARRLGIKATPYRQHRMALACIFLAEKYLEDIPLSVKCMAKLGGVHAQELIRLESTAISLLDWKLEVPLWMYWEVTTSICTTALYYGEEAGEQSIKYSSYGDGEGSDRNCYRRPSCESSVSSTTKCS